MPARGTRVTARRRAEGGRFARQQRTATPVVKEEADSSLGSEDGEDQVQLPGIAWSLWTVEMEAALLAFYADEKDGPRR